MFHLIKNSLWKMTSLLVVTAVICAAFANASPAYAAAPTAVLSNPALQKWFQNEKDWLAVQQTNLEKTAGRVDKVQALIDKANAAGKDTTTLQAALAIYQLQIATAQNAHIIAAALLAGHAGFDDQGSVIDPAAARLMLTEAHQSLSDAAALRTQAGVDLDRAVAQWLKDQKITNLNLLLQKDLQAEQKWLAVQTKHLADTSKVIVKVQALITRAQGNGKNVTDLQSALALYQSQIATAQSAHATAAAILAAHNGFDASGKVTDRDAARLTVNSARQSLNDAHRSLWQAARDLFHAINQWRKAN